MFEQQILCHKLPDSFNSITINFNQEQDVNKRSKMIQYLKRQMLNTELEQYELKIQHYEHLFEQELTAFQSEIYKTQSSYQICHSSKLMHYVKIYVSQHKKLLLCQIRYKESIFHVKLLRHQSLTLGNTVDVYPQIIVDVSNVSLTPSQLDYLSRKGQ